VSTSLALAFALSLLAAVARPSDTEKPAANRQAVYLTADQKEFLSLEPILVRVRLQSTNDHGLPAAPGEGKTGTTLRFEVEPAVKARPKGQSLPLEARATATTIQSRLYDLSEWFLFPDKGGPWKVRAVFERKGSSTTLRSEPLSVTIRKPGKEDKEQQPVARIHHTPWSNYQTNAFCGDTFDLVKNWPSSRLARYCHYWNGQHSQHKKEYSKALASYRIVEKDADFALADHAAYGAVECLVALKKFAEAQKANTALQKRVKERAAKAGHKGETTVQSLARKMSERLERELALNGEAIVDRDATTDPTGRGAPAQAGFFFKDGDTVVMIGDSITEQHLYSNYVEMWTVTRFPKWQLTFRNTGIGGDTSRGGNSRFKRDVLSYKPTAMTVDFGMNDGGYRAFDEGLFRNYRNGLQGMADQAKAAKIRVAWITPQPLDGGEQGQTALTGYNQTLEKFSAGVKQIAQKNEGLFVDQFHPYLAVLDKARGAAQKYSRITAGDAVHPGSPGQALMAASILKGLHLPTLVSSVEIDASDKPKEVATKNCKVSDLATKDGGITFERLDEALPFFPPEARPILKWAPILEELNDYRLKVTGLKEGNYEIRLGGKKVAEHSAADLAKGINLAVAALKTGPISDQVKAVKEAVEKKNRYHHDRIFRGVVLANVGQLPDWLGIKLTPKEIAEKRAAALKERLAKLPEFDAAVRKALEIKAHRVEIVPVKNQVSQ
jgi:lysophospholipase L1-like esterase